MSAYHPERTRASRPNKSARLACWAIQKPDTQLAGAHGAKPPWLSFGRVASLLESRHPTAQLNEQQLVEGESSLCTGTAVRRGWRVE